MKLVECPRDAMQGLHEFITTKVKVDYINQLLKVGFDTIDFGSFVSPKTIPQLRDTGEVLTKLDLEDSQSNLLAIVANTRGALDACNFEEIGFLGFPFSISETFQKRNINSTIQESFQKLADIQNICLRNNKQLVVYFSMAFGNPYGDEWSTHIVAHWVAKLLKELDITTLSLSDTIGVSNPEIIEFLFSKLIPEFPTVEIGAHLHSTPDTWEEKVAAAYKFGCKRFDSAINGLGGCPMATGSLTGNIATENVIKYLTDNGIQNNVNKEELSTSLKMAQTVFS